MSRGILHSLACLDHATTATSTILSLVGLGQLLLSCLDATLREGQLLLGACDVALSSLDLMGRHLATVDLELIGTLLDAVRESLCEPACHGRFLGHDTSPI